MKIFSPIIQRFYNVNNISVINAFRWFYTERSKEHDILVEQSAVDLQKSAAGFVVQK